MTRKTLSRKDAVELYKLMEAKRCGEPFKTLVEAANVYSRELSADVSPKSIEYMIKEMGWDSGDFSIHAANRQKNIVERAIKKQEEAASVAVGDGADYLSLQSILKQVVFLREESQTQQQQIDLLRADVARLRQEIQDSYDDDEDDDDEPEGVAEPNAGHGNGSTDVSLWGGR